jgi:hypothetical protein
VEGTAIPLHENANVDMNILHNISYCFELPLGGFPTKSVEMIGESYLKTSFFKLKLNHVENDLK